MLRLAISLFLLLTITACTNPPANPGAVATISAPVAALPGSSVEDLIVVGPAGERAMTDPSFATFEVGDVPVGIVAVMDPARDFGWTAIYPMWFEDAPTPSSVARLTPAQSTTREVGPLSTAVEAIIMNPGLYHTDTDALASLVTLVEGLPATQFLASELVAHADRADPWQEPAVVDALNVAFAAAVAGLDADTAADAGSATMARPGPALTPSFVDGAKPVVSAALDWDLLLFDVEDIPAAENGVLLPVWNKSAAPLGKAVTWVGAVYRVDHSAYPSWPDLAAAWRDDHADDIALMQDAPVGAVRLDPNVFWDNLDLVGFIIDYTLDFVFEGISGGASRGSFEFPSEPGVYVVHMYSCTTHALEPENSAADRELIDAWAGGYGAAMGKKACFTFVSETIIDLAAILLPSLLELRDYEGLGKIVTDGLAHVELSIPSALSIADRDTLPGQIWGTAQYVVQSLAEGGAKAGIKTLLSAKAKQWLFLASAAPKAGKFGARLADAFLTTPFEGAVYVLGDPWAASANPTDALLAHYTFEDDLGTDASGRGNHATAFGGPTKTPGVTGSAVLLDGVDDYLRRDALHGDGALTAYTHTAWLRIDGFAANPDASVVFSDESSDGMFGLQVTPEGHVRPFHHTGANYLAWPSGPAVQLGSWHHYATVWDGSEVILYLDGAERGRVAASGKKTASAGVVIGGLAYWIDTGINDGGLFDGAIDELRVYGRALTEAEIAASYAAGAPGVPTDPESGLIAHYTFDDCDGSDASGNGNTATIPGSASCVPGPMAQAMDFSGTSGTTLAIPQLPVSNASRSLAAWVRMDAGTSSAQDRGIAGWGGTAGPASAFALRFGIGSSYTYGLWLHTCDNDLIVGGGDCVGGTPGALTGAWHHLAATYDGATGEAVLYFDGLETARRNLLLNTASTSFGLGTDAGSGVAAFPGVIDDVRLYGRALRAAEVLGLATPGP